MKRRAAFRVIQYTNRSGAISFRVSGTKENGDRVRENFLTEGEATARKQELEVEALNIEPASKLRTTRLTDLQIAEAEQAFGELNGKPIIPAIRFYLENYVEPNNKTTIQAAYDDFLKAKIEEGCRHDTIRNLRARVGALAKQHGEKLVSDIQRSHIIAITSRGGVDRTTRDNDRRAFSSFFSWCMDEERGYCADNPAKKKQRSKRSQTDDETEPTILPLSKVRALLDTATKFKDGKLVPYMTLAIFCGIRPKELSRLKWRDISLMDKQIVIGAKVAKTRGRGKRIVEISDNAIAWLAPHEDLKTAIVGPNWRKDFDQLKLLCGYGTPTKKRPHLQPWPQDCMRHSAISYYFRLHQHEGRAADWSGNSVGVIHRHYRALITNPKDVEEFWSILPTDAESKIVQLAAQ